MSYTILTVDDSRTIRAIVKNAFKGYDCELFEAENGRDGLAAASEIKPDLIILDITMPVMNGIEMLGKLMQNNHLKETAVIMLTAESGRDHVMNIVKMGVKDYIVKPFKGEELVERARLILKDLRPRFELSEATIEGGNEKRFEMDGDVVILNLPPKITRNIAGDIEAQVKSQIIQMKAAGVRKLILNLCDISHLSMTVIQSILALVGMCMRAKFSIRISATQSQAEALKGFKETQTVATKPTVREALMDF